MGGVNKGKDRREHSVMIGYPIPLNKPTGGDRLPDRAADTVEAHQGGAGNSAFPNDLRGSCGAIRQTTSAL